MIQSFHIINHRGEKLTLELAAPEKSGFAVANVTGLGPGKATITITDLVVEDGGVFKLARLPSRNIVFSIRFWSWQGKLIEDIRHESYDYFPIKKPITLIVEADTRVNIFEGYVESNEPVIFSKESYTQISMICPNPYAIGETRSLLIAGVVPGFEFPFTNEGPNPQLIMGNIMTGDLKGSIIYDGDVDVGIVMDFEFDGPAEDIVVYNLTSNELLTLNTTRFQQIIGSGIQQGDKIQISTRKGQKWVRLFRNGAWTNILNILDRRSPWYTLTKGLNSFLVRASTGEINIRLTISYSPLYEGV